MFPIFFRRFRKSLFVILPLALLAGYSVHDALSHYTGGVLVAGYALPGIGCGAGVGCHDPFPDTTTVIHLSVPAQIIAGNTYTLQVSVSNPDPLDSSAGFDIDIDTPATFDTIPGMNTILTFSPFTQAGNLWSISHSVPQQFKGDSAVWSFQYTARPTAGIDTLYLAGNAVDNDSATADSQDHWNQIVAYINVQAASSVAPAPSINSFQAYPNPATNAIFVNDGNPSDAGSYTLTDAAGRVVLNGNQIPLDGKHSIDVSRIAAGAYMLNVRSRNGQSFSRSIVIQR